MDKGFLYKLAGLTVALGGFIFALSTIGYFSSYRSFVWLSLAFLCLISVLVYMIMQRALSMKEHANFVVAFSTGFGIKSLASLAFISYFIFIKPISNTHFIFPFFFMYFAYTGLLVWDIWQTSRRKPLP